MQTRPARHRGLTITESLTALVLLAIGVLCIATVYLERTQAAPAVLLHSKANRLAQEMAEQLSQQQMDQVHFENPVGVRCDPRLTGAPPQKRVNNSIACWQEKVAQTLPNGSGAIGHENQIAPAYLITVSWSPPKRGTASYLLRVAAPSILKTGAKTDSNVDSKVESKKTKQTAPSPAGTAGPKSAEAPVDSLTTSGLNSNSNLTGAAMDGVRAAN